MPSARKPDSEGRDLAGNRAAAHEYHLHHRLEAGIVLTGAEVKSAREGRVSLKEAFAKLQNGEVFLLNAHFTPYSNSDGKDGDPCRPRKLLLHRREIRKLAKEMEPAGTTLVPTRLYLKSGRIKVELAVARGKKQYDKREDSRRREADREIARATSDRARHLR